jgi:hypothetical protein
MFPVIALGALIFGGMAAATAATSDAKEAPRGSRSERMAASGDGASSVRAAVSPQSYVVTPVSAGQAQQLSAVDAVRNFVV